ncbi:hypothetical protein [Streptomyces sp. MB09-02B]|uniref:hypothetical protein n=1 Tax=Streptomyces sp. MB09-02B TaxID=3028667 RepID=UPI0039B113C2
MTPGDHPRQRKADDVRAEILPDFAAASAPGRRFRCHHPVRETDSTRDLAAQAVAAPAPRSDREAQRCPARSSDAQ